MAKTTSWESFKSDAEALAQLRRMPRYQNTAWKSLYRRAVFFGHLLWCKITRKDKPLFVVLVTNNDCNLDCSYCYGEYGKRTARDNYSTIKLLTIIDELKELGCRLLTLHGGEALLRKDIVEILNYCKLKGFYVSLNTNGYLVPKRIDELTCVDTIIFSLDGSQRSNDRNRGQGSFARVMQAMELTIERHIPTVISATLTAHNEAIEEIEFLAKLGKERGVRIQYSLLYNEDKLAKQADFDGVLPSQRMREAVSQIKKLKRQGYPIYFADNVLDAAIDWELLAGSRKTIAKSELSQVQSRKMIPCYHGKLKYQIDADGRVVRCWAWDKPDAPNIKTLGLAPALKACNSDDDCQHCPFLANNEHNAMLNMSVSNLAHVASIQVADAMKIGAGRSWGWFRRRFFSTEGVSNRS